MSSRICGGSCNESGRSLDEILTLMIDRQGAEATTATMLHNAAAALQRLILDIAASCWQVCQSSGGRDRNDGSQPQSWQILCWLHTQDRLRTDARIFKALPATECTSMRPGNACSRSSHIYFQGATDRSLRLCLDSPSSLHPPSKMRPPTQFV